MRINSQIIAVQPDGVKNENWQAQRAIQGQTLVTALACCPAAACACAYDDYLVL